MKSEMNTSGKGHMNMKEIRSRKWPPMRVKGGLAWLKEKSSKLRTGDRE